MRVRLGLLTLAAALGLAAPAGAALPSGNIVANGDAEAGPAANNASDFPVPSGWEVTPNFTAVAYGTPDFPDASASTAINGGNNFFAGGPSNGFSDISVGTQMIDLSGSGSDLDASGVTATLSGDLGGFGSQGDSAAVQAVFTNADQSQATGVLGLQAVTPQDRGGQTELLPRSACTTLQPGTRNAFVQVLMQRTDGSYNDGYADNISLRLSRNPCSTLPPPTPPQPGVSGNAAPTRGRVLVKVPGTNRFQELTDERSIPVGSEVNAENGEVQLQTAANATGAAQIGKFGGGKFVLKQKRARAPITDLVLSGTQLKKCPRRGHKIATTARRRSRHLFGNAHGHFRTRGRYASATVRGTQWSVTDTCTTTTVHVSRGTVTVRDLVKRRNIRVKAPKSYIARIRRG